MISSHCLELRDSIREKLSYRKDAALETTSTMCIKRDDH